MTVQGAMRIDPGRRPTVRSRTALTVEDILVMERPELLRLWRQIVDCDAPRNASARFLQRALGHALQVRQAGDVPARMLKALQKLADGKVPPAGCAAAIANAGANAS